MSTIDTQLGTLPATGTWNVDAVHSTVGFSISYLGTAFRGTFRDFSASFDAASARLEGSAEVASVEVKDESLAAHLQSPDFFDAERHPQIRFVSSDVRLEEGQVVADGELTIKGQTHPVEVRGTTTGTMTDPYGNERLGLDLTATIDRYAFGVSWNAQLPSGGDALPPQVTLTAQLSLVKAA